jgi:hypothetical protein
VTTSRSAKPVDDALGVLLERLSEHLKAIDPEATRDFVRGRTGLERAICVVEQYRRRVRDVDGFDELKPPRTPTMKFYA